METAEEGGGLNEHRTLTDDSFLCLSVCLSFFLSLFFFLWVLGVELRLPCLCIKCLYLLGNLSASC